LGDAVSAALRQTAAKDAPAEKEGGSFFGAGLDGTPRTSLGSSAEAALPPALLTNADYYGTLAAVRSLGRAGIRVTVADPSRFGVSSWSKYATARVKSPRVRNTDEFLTWLLDFGAKNGRHVLLPTSDDTAWLYALHREDLSYYFDLASPSVDVIYSLLNKRRLYQKAVDAGLDVPRTWFPESAAEVIQCGSEARFPVVVKPVTQVMFKTSSKGICVQTADQLQDRYAEFARQPHEDALLQFDPTAARPMVQEFYPEAATGIYNISAYADRGRLCGVRAARKLLQQPRQLGVGVCFEEASVAPELAAGLERLVSTIGFSGIFEAEFIQRSGEAMLIDFNPRFYNQMGFDISRGLPLPLLAYYDALGSRTAFKELCDRVSPQAQSQGAVSVDLSSLRVLLFVQRLSGALSYAEKKKWTEWYDTNRDRRTDCALDADDVLPFWFGSAKLMIRYGRHPRSFFRSIVLNRA
jgi:predicted ATP-grasp superfamily ATP-dependent carboligase